VDTAEAAEALPSEFGDYEIEAEIGRGGAGIVYRARHRGLNRVVALKTLHGASLGRRDAFQRLQIESKAVARLEHPHIVPLYEIGRHAGTHFLTLRYFEHGSVANALRHRGFTPQEAARLVSLAARAVQHAHSRGVLHRDIKPSNLLLDERGDPHVADFGLAKLADDDTGLTLSTSVLGTPAYMAPEQASGNIKTVGTAADIYSLGAVLYELLTGRPPFVGSTALEVIRLVADTDPARPRSLNPSMDPELEAICLHCLEKNPDRRYSTAATLADDLDRWLRHEPVSLRPLSTGERVVQWVRRRPLIAAMAGMIAGSVAMGATGILWQWRRATAAAAAAQRNAYFAEMNAANHALGTSDWTTVRAILDRTRPKAGEPDLRGWEWRYLWSVSRSDDAVSVPVPGQGVVSIAVLPDGQTVALGEREGGFSLRDARSGELVFEFPEPINRVKAAHFPLNRIQTKVAMIPGTPWLAFTDCRSETESYVRLWNIHTRTTERSIPFAGVPRDLAVSPDGALLACSTLQGEKRIDVFEVKSGQRLQSFPSRLTDFAVGNAVAFSPDSTRLAFEADNGAHGLSAVTRVVDLRTGETIHTLSQDQYAVHTVVFSPGGQWLATAGGFDKPLVRIWDLREGTLAKTLAAAGHTALAFSPDGQRLHVGLGTWSVPGFVEGRRLVGEEAGVDAVCPLADDVHFVTAHGRSVRFWDLNRPGKIRGPTVLEIHPGTVDFLPAGRGVVVCGTNGIAFEALAPTYQCRPLPVLGKDCHFLRVLPERNEVAVSRKDGRITLHNLESYRQTDELPPGPRVATGMYWAPVHGLLAVYRERPGPGSVADIEVWNLLERRITWETATVPFPWRDAFSRQEGIAYQIHSEGRLIGYDFVHHRVTDRQLVGNNFTGVSFSADGRHLLATQWSGQQLLDARSLQMLRTFHLQGGASHGSAIWSDGTRYLFTDCRIVDPVAGRILLDLKSPFGVGHRPAVSLDGSQVLLVSDSLHDARTSLWWAPSWEQIAEEESQSWKNAPQ
jgi:WD40 repeat protein/tRNA A-37 threonylcarbamoyl transferase component Bud32